MLKHCGALAELDIDNASFNTVLGGKVVLLLNPEYSDTVTSLTTLVFGKNVTSIGEGGGRFLPNLESLTFSASLQSIGEFAFIGDSKLTSVIIPASVTAIGSFAFDNKSLTVNCEAASKPEGWEADWAGACKVVWGYKG